MYSYLESGAPTVMANVAVTIAMAPTYQPFERPPDPAALWTAIPRGLRGFLVNVGALDAKPVNDTETLSLTATLPASFAYVFAEISLTIAQDQAGDWDTRYVLNLQNWYQGVLALSSDFGFDFSPVGLGAGERGNGIGAMDQVPRAPMWAPSGTSGILINISTFNDVATVAAAGTVNAYINFWEFDLEQARKFPINSPYPVHSR